MRGCHLLFAKRTEAKVGVPARALELVRCGMVGNQEGMTEDTTPTMMRQRKIAALPTPFSAGSHFLIEIGFSGCLGDY